MTLEAASPSMDEVGSRLGRLRMENKLTIGELAASAGVSQGLISQIERGQGNPSFGTLVKLAHALHTPVGALFSGEEAEERSGLVRADERRRLVISSTDIEYELLTPRVGGRLAVYMTRIPPGWTNEHLPSQHEGEEVALIIEGELLLYVGAEQHHLFAGDSLTFDAMAPHWSRNPTDRVTVGVKAATPSTF